MNRTENGSVKLYSERLAKIKQLEERTDAIESQLKQLIDEITPILNSHAEAIKKLLNRNNAST